MTFSPKTSLNNALKSAWIIIKLIVPIYIIADVLFYYEVLQKISFIFTPLTAILDLPPEAALSIISGMLLNLYAAIAFAAPIDLDSRQWTILAVFLGICHALLVETAIMRQLSIPKSFSIILRFGVGLFVGWITTLLPKSFFQGTINTEEVSTISLKHYDSLRELLQNSVYEAFILTVEVIILITIIIFIMDYIKALPFIDRYSKKVNSAFSLGTGVILGITYGAGILISEYKNSSLSTKEIWFVGTFLMICHAIIEDTLLFVIFGANPWVIVSLRIVFATFFALVIGYIIANKKPQPLS